MILPQRYGLDLCNYYGEVTLVKFRGRYFLELEDYTGLDWIGITDEAGVALLGAARAPHNYEHPTSLFVQYGHDAKKDRERIERDFKSWLQQFEHWERKRGSLSGPNI